MSWRLLFAILVVAAGAAAWGGVNLGDWLVAHAPQAILAHGQGDAAAQDGPVLDANGRPYVAQPPQPRVDGTLGVPDRPAGSDWTIPTISLFDTVTDPSVQISRGNVTLAQAEQYAAQSGLPLPSGSGDIATLDLANAPQAPAGQQPAIPVPAAPPITAAPGFSHTPLVTRASAPTPAPAAAGAAAPAQRPGAWQDALRQELAQCANQGFFDRPTCAWNARNKYCGPNRAWGTIAECPNRP